MEVVSEKEFYLVDKNYQNIYGPFDTYKELNKSIKDLKEDYVFRDTKNKRTVLNTNTVELKEVNLFGASKLVKPEEQNNSNIIQVKLVKGNYPESESRL